MNTELWIDNCHNIAIHYSTYPVEPHFNFLIKKIVPEPYQASSETTYFDHHGRGHNCTKWYNRAPTAESGVF